jgi:hypothetical protein
MFGGVAGGASFSGDVKCGNIKPDGIIETYEIRTRGATTNDGVLITNIDGNEIAKFHNDFRCRLNGNTSIMGSLNCTGPIDAYRFICTEIRARDTESLAISTSTGTTSINILNNSNVEILAPIIIKK